MLHRADHQSADHVNGHDQQPCDGIAAHEFTGTVHGSVEVGFLRHIAAALFGFFLADDPGIQIRIDRHLFARHPVEDKTCADFCDTPGTFGDNHEVDDHQNDEHDDTDGKITAHQKVSECVDHLTRRPFTSMPIHQDDTGRRNVERQSQQRGKQQHRWECGEFQGVLRKHRHQQNHQRQHDIEGKQQIQNESRQRQNHHGQNGHDQYRTCQYLPLRLFKIR